MNNPIVEEDLEQIHISIPIDKLQDSSILVTGCAGFLGFYFMQYFVRYSKKIGIRRVIGLDNFMLNRPEWLQSLKLEFPDILDIREFDITRDNISNIEAIKDVTHVVHMASIASPVFYRKYPIETLDANIWGLRKLLDFYQDSKSLRGFLFFSSSEIYGDPISSEIPTEEEYRGNVSCVGPRACYDEAKRFGETMCYLYAKNFNMPITVARPFNNYGPGMRLDDKRLPADFAKCVLNEQDIAILSDGSPTRTFCYISDAITGYMKCLLHGEYDYFNIGIDHPEITVLELAKIYQNTASELFGVQISLLYEQSKDPDYLTDNPNRRCPVIDKARKVLGYDPKILVQEGIRRYLKFLKHEKETA